MRTIAVMSVLLVFMSCICIGGPVLLSQYQIGELDLGWTAAFVGTPNWGAGIGMTIVGVVIFAAYKVRKK